MKYKIFIPVVLLFAVIGTSFMQGKSPAKKIYGYKQASIPGILPKNTAENGVQSTGKSRSRQTFNYWFYIEIARNEKINVTGLWIAGIAYDLKSEMVDQTPVKKIIFSGTAKNDTTIMVPRTKNKILLVYPAGETQKTVPDPKYVKELTSKNELVISYVWKNKTQYATVKKLRELNPDVRP